MMRGFGVRWTLLFPAALLQTLLLATASQASKVPRELSRADAPAVAALLEPLQTQGQLSAYLGEEPSSCVEAMKAQQICSWNVGPNRAAWGKLAPMLASSTSLTLLCELPVKDRSRKKGSCTVHENKSAKGIWEPAANQWAEENKGVKGGLFSGGKQREARGERAGQILAGARTALAISRLVGAAPTSCTGVGRVRTCLWKANRSVQGFPLLSDWLDTSKKIRLWCDVPEDGSPRAADSCRGEVGD